MMSINSVGITPTFPNLDDKVIDRKALKVSQDFSQLMLEQLLKISQKPNLTITETHTKELFNKKMAETVAKSPNFQLTEAIYNQIIQFNGNK
ncbi:hypothetical protein [Photobacterium toruni]|uniref:hypothetical protein n=1 Tax=Photobacterium toruni TaxID=1935446 RepID=UPI00210F7A16|nr:hypothetical protein [Photobacterium toruni]